MLTTQQFIDAAKAGTIDLTKVRVVVDNDCVDAYTIPDEEDGANANLCRFDGEGPEGVVIALLKLHGIKADRA